VNDGQEVFAMSLSGSDRKYSVQKKPTDAIDLVWVLYEVEERDSGQLSRKFTVKLTHTQSTREKVEQVIARWCKINKEKLPPDGGTVTPDLDNVEVRVDRR
jgi:K+/H+ antiporter YhaU regulatory subunit KhtT